MILTLSTSCSSSLKVTQQRELKSTTDYSKNNLPGRPDQIIEKLRRNISHQKSQTCTQLMQGHTSTYIRECCRGRTKSKFQVHQIINTHFHFHQHTFPIQFTHFQFIFHTFHHRETQSQNQQGTFLFLKEFHQTHAQRSVFTSRRSSYQNKYT